MTKSKSDSISFFSVGYIQQICLADFFLGRGRGRGEEMRGEGGRGL